MTKRDIITHASLMKCYANNGMYSESIEMFNKYKLLECNNPVVYIEVLQACAAIKDAQTAELIYEYILNRNINNSELHVALINYFGTVGDNDKMEHVFKSAANKNIDAYNGIMSSYVKQEMFQDALMVYQSIPRNVNKDSITYNIAINACMHLKDTQYGQTIYDDIVRSRLNNIELLTSVINYFGNINDIIKAESIFNNIDNKNTHTYNCMMKLYTNNELYDDALKLFKSEEMKHMKDEISYNIAIYCCSDMESILEGESIINELKRNDLDAILYSVKVQSSMIALYGKNGEIEKACQIFRENMNTKKYSDYDVNRLYSSIMDCYAKLGNIEEVISLFHELQQSDVKINDYIHSIVINSCSHTGSTNIADDIFQSYITHNNKQISGYLFNGIIDCFARKGNLIRAQQLYHTYHEFVNDYHCKITALISILKFCKVHNELEIGKQIAALIKDIYIQNNDKNISRSLAKIWPNINIKL